MINQLIEKQQDYRIVSDALRKNLKKLNPKIKIYEVEDLARKYFLKMQRDHFKFHTLENVRTELELVNQDDLDKEYYIKVAAILFKDYCYNPGKKSYKQDSIKCMEDFYPRATAQCIGKYILATCHTFPFKAYDDGRSLVCDVDLSIFCMSLEDFSEYFQKIRDEHESVLHPSIVEEEFRNFFEKLLEQSENAGVYRTVQFKIYEEQLRVNVRSFLATISKE